MTFRARQIFAALLLFPAMLGAQTTIPAIPGYTVQSITLVATPPAAPAPVPVPAPAPSPSPAPAPAPAPPTGITLPALTAGVNATLPAGYRPFTGDYALYQDISQLPVSDIDATVTGMGTFGGAHLNPDASMGYVVFDSRTTPMRLMTSFTYPDSSDDVPYPVLPPTESGSDQHLLALDSYSGHLYEVWQMVLAGDGSISCGGAVVWDTTGRAERPFGLSSTDAAGLPIFPLTVKYDEAVNNRIHHAIRWTFKNTKRDSVSAMFVPPATFGAAELYGPNTPQGLRFRLKASFDVSGFSPQGQGILNAMKTYGTVIADNGQTGIFQLAPGPWGDFSEFLRVHISDFEVVTPSKAFLDTATAPKGPLPTIDSFAATVSNGKVIVAAAYTGAYGFLLKMGPLRTGTQITLPYTPGAAYTLVVRNLYGTTTKTITTP